MDSRNQSNEASEEAAKDLNHLLQQLLGSTICVDPNGDLDLIVGLYDASRTFRVSAPVMRLVSPVWRMMLSPENGFKESKFGEGPITFPEDDVLTFFIVLLAGHSRFQMIPEQIEFKQLVNLCVTCDKYDCISVLGPWISAWISPWTKDMAAEGYEEWLFVAWVLGDEIAFKRIVGPLILICQTNEFKQCLNSSLTVLDEKLPPGLAESILDARHAALTKIIEACHSMVTKYVWDTPFLCEESDNEEECDALVLGHLVKRLQKMGIYPGDPGDIASHMKTTAVEEIIADVMAIKISTYPEGKNVYGRTYYHADHSDCGCSSSLRQSIQDIVPDQVDKVLAASRKHLEAQRQKLEPSKLYTDQFRG